MSKTLNHNLKPWAWILLILLVAFIILCNWSCSPAKKLDAAEKRVLADIESVKRVRGATADLFPCSNDTVTNTVHDTTTNTLVKTVSKTDTVIKDGIKYVFNTDTAYFEKERTIYRDRVITDHELTNRQKDSINSLRIQVGFSSGQIAELKSYIKAKGKTITNLWLVISGLILIICILLYFTLKGVITKIPGMVGGLLTKIKS